MHFATRKIALLALGALGMFTTVGFAAAAETAVRDPKILTALRQTPLLVIGSTGRNGGAITEALEAIGVRPRVLVDRKSTRLNSSHSSVSRMPSSA